MTDKELWELWRQAVESGGGERIPTTTVVRFARLVAAREREAVAAEVALALKVRMPHDLLLDAIRKRGES